jgi:hypothetical protein
VNERNELQHFFLAEGKVRRLPSSPQVTLARRALPNEKLLDDNLSK